MARERFLIFGCGRTGSRVAAALWKQGHPVTVMDMEPDRFLALPPEMQRDSQATYLGNATLDEDLEAAGIQNVKVFVAVSSRDNLNALAALKARYTFGVPRVICRIGDPDRHRLLEDLGLTVVSPTLVTVDLVLKAILEERNP